LHVSFWRPSAAARPVERERPQPTESQSVRAPERLPEERVFGSPQVNPVPAELGSENASVIRQSLSDAVRKRGDPNFVASFTERGIAYGDTGKTETKVNLQVLLTKSVKLPEVRFEANPVTIWGINFAASLVVVRATTQTRIFLPGVRTYDPAGITGDSHASERVGPSCARTQTAITALELQAIMRGASVTDLAKIQEAFSSVIARYHGRVLLFKWMALQLREALIDHKAQVTPYPDFIKREVEKGQLDVRLPGRNHTRRYLDSYRRGSPAPPPAYFAQVLVKDGDNLDAVLTQAQIDHLHRLVHQPE